MSGRLILVGAGPGDTGLLTLRGREALCSADVIIYDYLVNPAHLSHCRPGAERLCVGRGFRHKRLSQERIHRLILRECRRGRTVVRLKGGDPYLFGRGAEEGLFAIRHGIAYECVPGVTSATAAAAYAGVPLTYRHHNASVTFVTGHRADDKGLDTISWKGIVSVGGTLVIYMGLYNLAVIARKLIANGLPARTPVCVVEWGTLPRQRSVSGELGGIAERVRKARLQAPCIIVIGEVVRLRRQLNWYEKLPLFGQTILVTRMKQGAGELSRLLRQKGADVIELPVIAIRPPARIAALDRALSAAADHDWLVLTSRYGVLALREGLDRLKKDARLLAGPRIACVGPETAAELSRCGLRADVCADTGGVERLRVLLGRTGPLRGKRFLLLRSAIAPDTLERWLLRRGAIVRRVEAYTTELGAKKLARGSSLMQNILRARLVLFASSSAVDGLQRTLGKAAYARLLRSAASVCIGASTAATLRRSGARPAAVARRSDLAGLVEAAVRAARARRTADHDKGAR